MIRQSEKYANSKLKFSKIENKVWWHRKLNQIIWRDWHSEKKWLKSESDYVFGFFLMFTALCC